MKREKYDYFKDAGNHLLKFNIHSIFKTSQPIGIKDPTNLLKDVSRITYNNPL